MKKKYNAYMKIYDRVREDIVNGSYPVGTKLPSKRVMAAESGISTVTVEHAYTLLCDEGYIEPRERSGYFVIFRSEDGFAATHGTTATRLTVGTRTAETSAFPFSVLARTMRRVLSDAGEEILSRSPSLGLAELREAIRQYLSRNRAIHAAADQIVIGSGSEYLYGLLAELLGKDRVYGIESPSYEKIEQVYRAEGVACELLPLGADGIESQALLSTHASVLHITPYRSYPTGISATASKRHEYIRWASEGGRVIIEDDFESEFSISSKPEETLYSLSCGDNVIYMNSFSKTVSPAMRVGYMVLPPRLAEEFVQKLGFYSCTVPTFEQMVLAELITSGDFERHINHTRREKRRLLLDKNKQ